MNQELIENLIKIAIVSLSISIIFAINYFCKLYFAKAKAKKEKGFLIQIIPPKYQLEDADQRGVRFALQRFIDNLTASVKDSRISLEIYADASEIKFLVWTPSKKIAELVKLNLYSTYNDRIKIRDIETDPINSFSDDSIVNEYKTSKHDIYMLMDLKDFESVDPVQDILGAMRGLKEDEKILFQIAIKPSTLDVIALQKAKENFRLGRSEITWIELFLQKISSYLIYFVPLLPILAIKVFGGILTFFKGGNINQDPIFLLPDSDPRKVLVEKEELSDFNSRISEKYKTSFSTNIRVIADGIRKDILLDGFEQALESMKSETQNRLIRKSKSKAFDLQNRFVYPEDSLFPFYKELFTSQNTLSSREISMVYHIPYKIDDPVISSFASPDLPARKLYKEKTNSSDLFLGINKSRNIESNVFLSEENRKRHIVINGQTGTGKSTIMKNFVLQDIDQNLLSGNKRGLMLMDPHEDFFIDILERLPETEADLEKFIPWDTTSEDYYFGFNPLYAVGLSEREIDLIVDSNFKLIEKVIRRINPESGMGMTGKPMLINAMKTLMVFQNEWLERVGKTDANIEIIKKHAPTLLDVRSLFISDEECSTILSFIPLEKYEGLRTFWEDILPNYKESQNWSEIRQGFDNKISQILTGILFFTFAQSQSSIEISEIIRESKILLVNLSSKNIGEEGMGLLGSLLMSKVWFEAKKIEKSKRNPFVVYADEFQNFANSDFASALSEARKFKLELILAHQFFQQLPEEVFHAVMGNVKSKIYYRCGLEDSEMIAKELQGRLLQNEVMEIPEFHANIKVGEDVFSVYVPVERKPSKNEIAVKDIIENSYQKYAKTRLAVEQNIIERRNWIRDGCQSNG